MNNIINSKRRISIAAGMLILLGIIAGIFSIVPSAESADYLTQIVVHKYQILTGALFQFFLVPIYLGFALLLYPLLKQYKSNLALGFVSFRIIAAVFQLIGVILLPQFLFLSQEFSNTDNLDSASMEIMGHLLKLGRDLANHLGVMLATGMGNLLLYYVLYKTKLIPNWLSIWGLLGNTLAMLTSFLILFGSIEVVSVSFASMTIPLVIQELVLSIWLIVRGFDKNLILSP